MLSWLDCLQLLIFVLFFLLDQGVLNGMDVIEQHRSDRMASCKWELASERNDNFTCQLQHFIAWINLYGSQSLPLAILQCLLTHLKA